MPSTQALIAALVAAASGYAVVRTGHTMLVPDAPRERVVEALGKVAMETAVSWRYRRSRVRRRE